MIAASFSFEIIIICSVSTLSLAKPFISEEKNFGDENLNCMDSAENSDYAKSSQYRFNDFYNKPVQSRFEGSDRFNKPFDIAEKRSISGVNKETALQKRQVGVVYKDEKPIGILQPFQRSYRFIPVNEQNSFDLGENQNPYNMPHKRDTNEVLDDGYPSILTNFKIGSKLDKKRNFNTLTDENVRNLKTTIRRLRSANSHNTEQIEEQLKNILDDMGLIDDEESHAGKREAVEEKREENDESLLDDEAKLANERSKRDKSDTETSNKIDNSLGVEKRATDNENYDSTRLENSESSRQKRQKPEALNQGANLVENLKDSGDLMLSGNKSPLASTSEMETRDVDDKIADEDYEKRVERQIQNKINSLKEEVKREINALKKKTDEDEIQRKKRQVVENLVDEEKEELNPVKNNDQQLKPLIRRKRSTDTSAPFNETTSNENHSRRKREIAFEDPKIRRSVRSSDNNDNVYKVHREDGEEGDNLLGEEFEDSAVSKREIDNEEYRDANREDFDEALYERDKRSRPRPDMYERYLDTENDYYDDDRYKRQSYVNGKIEKRFASSPSKYRLRRRINEDQAVENRPQQLSDMSDLDLFGALPKSYSGELSRYKRVRRK